MRTSGRITSARRYKIFVSSDEGWSPDTPSRHKSRIGPRDPVGVVVRVTGILSVMILLNGEDRLELSPAPPGRPTLASHFAGTVTVVNNTSESEMR